MSSAPHVLAAGVGPPGTQCRADDPRLAGELRRSNLGIRLQQRREMIVMLSPLSPRE